MAVTMRAARRITVFCPVESTTLAALLAGEQSALERDPIAAPVLAIIRADNPLGDFGLYDGVFEVAYGLEGFTATARATPALGGVGSRTLSPTVTITTYVDAAADPFAVDAALAALIQAHPWEIPVIEISDTVALAAPPRA